MTTMGSLPFCVDEITTMKPEAVQELDHGGDAARAPGDPEPEQH
jgi:polyribonucleotide nucleotidyltransferase